MRIAASPGSGSSYGPLKVWRDDEAVVQIGGAWKAVQDAYIQANGQWEKVYYAANRLLPRGDDSLQFTHPAIKGTGATEDAGVKSWFQTYWQNNMDNGGAYTALTGDVEGVTMPILRTTFNGSYYQRYGNLGVIRLHNSGGLNVDEEWELTFKYRKVSGANANIYATWLYSLTNTAPDFFGADTGQVGSPVSVASTNNWTEFKSRVNFINNGNYVRVYFTVEANNGACVIDVADVKVRRIGTSLLDNPARVMQSGGWTASAGNTLSYGTSQGRQVTQATRSSTGQIIVVALTGRVDAASLQTYQPCRPGYTYRVKARAYSPALVGTNGVVCINWYTSAKGLISQSRGTAVPLTSGFRELSLVATAPAGAVYCETFLISESGSVTSGQYIQMESFDFDVITDPPANRNLLSAINSGFEGSVGSWANAGSANVVYGTLFPWRGSGNLAFQCQAATSYVWAPTYTPITAGQMYTASIYVRPNQFGSADWRLIHYWYNASNGFMSSVTPTGQTPAADTYSRLWSSALAPAGAVSHRLLLQVNNATNVWFDCDCAQVEQGHLTEWVIGA